MFNVYFVVFWNRNIYEKFEVDVLVYKIVDIVNIVKEKMDKVVFLFGYKFR